MRRVTAQRGVVAGLLFTTALFCVFGVLATFEPSPRAVPFRILYATTGAAALVAGAWTLFWKK